MYSQFVGRDHPLGRLQNAPAYEQFDAFVVYGLVQYRDMFSDSEEYRKMEFCFVWDKRLKDSI